MTNRPETLAQFHQILDHATKIQLTSLFTVSKSNQETAGYVHVSHRVNYWDCQLPNLFLLNQCFAPNAQHSPEKRKPETSQPMPAKHPVKKYHQQPEDFRSTGEISKDPSPWLSNHIDKAQPIWGHVYTDLLWLGLRSTPLLQSNCPINDLYGCKELLEPC